MKILILAPQPFYRVRGTPIAVRAVAEVLAGRGHTLDILTYHEGEDVRIEGCRIRRIPAPPGVRDIGPGLSAKKVLCDVVMLFACAALVGRERYDLIHAVEEAGFIAVAMKAVFGIPFVYDMDSSLPRQLVEKHAFAEPLRPALEAFEKLAVRESLAVLTMCAALEDIVRAHAPDKLVGTVEDFSLLDGAPAAPDATLESLRSRGPVVMYVGNFEPYQGVGLLLEGFAEALSAVPDAQLVAIGGSERRIGEHRRRARELGIGGNVHLLGPRPLSSLGATLSAADVLVSPRLSGTNTPMKIYSYLDSGTAVLATRLPTHTQVLDDEIAHLVAADAADLGAGLVTLLRDDALRRALSDAARTRVSQRYSRGAFQRKLLDFYATVEERVGRGRGP